MGRWRTCVAAGMAAVLALGCIGPRVADSPRERFATDGPSAPVRESGRSDQPRSWPSIGGLTINPFTLGIALVGAAAAGLLWYAWKD